ncbi:unnamed protein product [Moneuplotes crassus]|uniref:EamA domain-containing protein n=1 Tax=Euplotes crassus TaxID=5936 RepID=A0AAD1XHT6_EUPCR|nr:unnamed protein product [Moneuplotes crassus]
MSLSYIREKEKCVGLLDGDKNKFGSYMKRNNTPRCIISSFNEIQDWSLGESIGKVSKSGEEVTPQDKNALGIIYMIIGGISFSLAAIACKLAYKRNDYLTGFDYVLCRSIIFSICAIFQVILMKVNILNVKKGYRLLLFVRCIMGGIGVSSLFIAMKYVPLSLSMLIVNMNPLFVGIFAFFILKEKFTKLNAIGTCGALIGVYLLTMHKSGGSGSNQYFFMGIFLVSISCCCETGINILLRILNKELHYTMSPFWFSMTTIFISGSLLCFYPTVFNFEHYTYSEISLFLLSGAFNYGGQVFNSIAFKHADASLLSPLQYFNVLYLFLSDIVIFNSTFTALDILGGSIVLVSLLSPIFQAICHKNSIQ